MSGVRLNLSPNSSNVLRRLLLFLVLALLCCKVESCITHYAEQKLVKESGIVSLSELSRKVENKIKNLWNANHHDLFNCFLTMSESDISDVESRVSVESKTSPHARLPLQLVSASPTANPSATPNPSGSPVVHSTPSPSPGMAYLFIKILLRSFVTEEISSEIRLDLADAANVPIHNITLVNLQAGPILTYVLETERQLAPSLVQSLTFYIKSGQLAASINRGPIILVDDPIEFSEAGQSVNESQVAPGLRSTPLPTAGFHRVLYELRFNNFTTNIFTAAINNDIEDVLSMQLAGLNVSEILLTKIFNCSGHPPYVLADYITVFSSNETSEAINRIYKFVNSGAMQNLTHLDVIMVKMPKTMESLLQTSSSSEPVRAIVGGTIGGFVGVLIIIGMIIFIICLRRRRKKAMRDDSETALEKFGVFPVPPSPIWFSDSESADYGGNNEDYRLGGHTFFHTVHKIDEDLGTMHSSNNSGVAGMKWEGSIPFDTEESRQYADITMENDETSKVEMSKGGWIQKGSHEFSHWTPLDITKEMTHDAPWEIPFEELTLMNCIGVGGFGIVYSGLWHGTEVAVKKLLDQDLTENQIEEFRAEAKMMARLRHPNIVLFLGATTTPPNLSIVTELMALGSLYKVLHGSTKTHLCDDNGSEHASGSSSSQSRNLPLSWRQRVLMCIDAARGLNYLHQRHPPIVHRDLKSLNLLVSKNLTVKVSDFGLSRVRNRTFLTSRHCGGTPEWTAPEVLRSEQHNEKADIYSFGVIMWEMITRKVPFEGMTSMQIIAAVGFRKQKLPPPLIPNPLPPSLAGMDRFVEVMESCFSEPGRRPSMSQILSELCSIVQANNQSIAEYPPLRKNFSSSLAETTRPSSPSLRRTLTDSSYYDAKHAVETPATASLQTPLQKGPKEWMHLAPLDFSQLEF